MSGNKLESLKSFDYLDRCMKMNHLDLVSNKDIMTFHHMIEKSMNDIFSSLEISSEEQTREAKEIKSAVDSYILEKQKEGILEVTGLFEEMFQKLGIDEVTRKNISDVEKRSLDFLNVYFKKNDVVQSVIAEIQKQLKSKLEGKIKSEQKKDTSNGKPTKSLQAKTLDILAVIENVSLKEKEELWLDLECSANLKKEDMIDLENPKGAYLFQEKYHFDVDDRELESMMPLLMGFLATQISFKKGLSNHFLQIMKLKNPDITWEDIYDMKIDQIRKYLYSANFLSDNDIKNIFNVVREKEGTLAIYKEIYKDPVMVKYSDDLKKEIEDANIEYVLYLEDRILDDIAFQGEQRSLSSIEIEVLQDGFWEMLKARKAKLQPEEEIEKKKESKKKEIRSYTDRQLLFAIKKPESLIEEDMKPYHDELIDLCCRRFAILSPLFHTSIEEISNLLNHWNTDPATADFPPQHSENIKFYVEKRVKKVQKTLDSLLKLNTEVLFENISGVINGFRLINIETDNEIFASNEEQLEKALLMGYKFYSYKVKCHSDELKCDFYPYIVPKGLKTVQMNREINEDRNNGMKKWLNGSKNLIMNFRNAKKNKSPQLYIYEDENGNQIIESDVKNVESLLKNGYHFVGPYFPDNLEEQRGSQRS